jgi:DNA-binding response OmpR family regulator
VRRERHSEDLGSGGLPELGRPGGRRPVGGQGIAAGVAYDGTEAAGKLDVNIYDVVVLDRAPPGAPGHTLWQMISSSNERSMVLMLSGAASPTEKVEGFSLGADDYLVKPSHFPELVMRVRALARRQPRALPRVLRAGGVELDCLSRTVTRDSRPLKFVPSRGIPRCVTKSA